MNGRASRPEVSELIKSNHNKLLFDQCKSYGLFLKSFILIKYILISGSLMFSWDKWLYTSKRYGKSALMKHMHTSGAKEHHHRRRFEQNSDIQRTGHF